MERILDEMFDALEAGKTNSLTFCVNELPIPCTKGYEEWNVKDYFQKINEELDELKEEIYMGQVKSFRKARIAEEAADTITAIISMLEAMGIDEQARQAAQRRVNEHNKERNRL